MSIKILLADSITKRISYISNDSKENLNNNQYEKLFIIVPEQFNFVFQKKMLEMLNVDVISELEILSFTRLIHRIYEETNYFRVNLSNIEKEILINDIVDNLMNKFEFFNKYRVTDKIVKEISNVNKLIVKNMIDEKKIVDFYESHNSILANKLHDIYLIYEEYKKQCKNIGADLKTYEVLKDVIPKREMMKESKIYISDFYNFTNEQVEIINILSNAGADIEIVMQVNEHNESAKDELNIFTNIHKNIDKFINADVININKLNEKERNTNYELELLRKKYLDNGIHIYNDLTNDIYLTTYKTKTSEVLDVGFNIIKLIKKGYRYRDISVVVNGADNYRLVLEEIMSKFEIPYNIANDENLYASKLMRIIEKMIDCGIKECNSNSVISFLKEDEYKGISYDKVCFLENDVLKYGVNEISDDCNVSREIKKLIKFISENFNANVNQNISDYANKICDFINEFVNQEFIEKSKKEIECLSTILKTWGKVANDKYSLIEFNSDLISFTRDTSIDRISGKIDELEIYDKSRTNVLETKIMMLVGFSDNGTSFGKLTNIFTEKENNYLKTYDIEFNMAYIDLILEQRFLFFNMIDKASDKIYISYVDNDNGTSVEADSEIIKIKSSFTKLKRIEFENNEIIKNYLINDDVIILYLTKFLSNINENKNIIEELIGMIKDKNKLKEISEYTKSDVIRIDNDKENLRLSFSSIETYVKCPFQYFIRYMLGVNERDIKCMDAKFIGTSIHEILEKTFRKVIDKDIDVNEISDEEVINIINDIIKESDMFDKNVEDNRMMDFIDRFKNIAHMNIKNLLEQVRHGRFEITYVEEPFGNECTIKGIEFKTNSGKNVCLSGKIDRVDMCTENDKTYVKVIDYKTGKKKFDLDDISKGINIQLVIYLKVLMEHLKSKNIIPAGIFISKINSDIKKDEEIDLKDNKYSGIMLDDFDVLEMMDNEFRDSKILPVKLKNDSDEYTSYTKENVVSIETFNHIVDSTIDKVKEIANAISDGIMDVMPNEDLDIAACQYCLYNEICEKE